MTQGSEKEREEFEAWFVLRARQKNTSVLSGYTDGEIRDAFLSTTPEESGAYVCASIRMAWEAWQAARRAKPAQVPEGCRPVPQWGKAGTCEWHDGYADHSDGGGPYKERVLYAAHQPPEAAKDKPVDAVLQMLLEQKSKKDALIANGICPECEGKGECGGQFTGGEWTCEECNGTGKAHGIGKQDK